MRTRTFAACGSPIKTSVAGTDLTVRNSLAVAANAAVKDQPNGVFLEVASPVRLDVENNYIENAQGGVILHGYAGNREGEQNIVIRSNRARNLNGLLSDGNRRLSARRRREPHPGALYPVR